MRRILRFVEEYIREKIIISDFVLIIRYVIQLILMLAINCIATAMDLQEINEGIDLAVRFHLTKIYCHEEYY